jgi:hypothetical protein
LRHDDPGEPVPADRRTTVSNVVLRDRVQIYSGLVNLVVCVRRHSGGAHRLALAGQRFVGLVAEDIAEMSDRCGDFGKNLRGHGAEGETGDGGRGLMLSEPVEKIGEHGEGGTRPVWSMRPKLPTTRVLSRLRFSPTGSLFATPIPSARWTLCAGAW